MQYLFALSWYLIAIFLFIKGEIMLGFVSVVAGNTGMTSAHLGWLMYRAKQFELEVTSQCVACENGSACDTCSVKHK